MTRIRFHRYSVRYPEYDDSVNPYIILEDSFVLDSHISNDFILSSSISDDFILGSSISDDFVLCVFITLFE